MTISKTVQLEIANPQRNSPPFVSQALAGGKLQFWIAEIELFCILW